MVGTIIGAITFLILAVVFHLKNEKVGSITCVVCGIALMVFGIYMGVVLKDIGYASSSEPRCCICGKTGATQITNSVGDTNYYCPEHYSRAWQYYYGK